MTCFNSEIYLARALQSIREQTFKNYELLVVDDGSEDNTLAISTRFARCDHRVRVIRQAHLGPTVASNRGCHEARGRYIAKLDHDDVAMPYRLEEQVTLLEQSPNLALLGGAAEIITADDRVITRVTQPTGCDRVATLLRRGNVIHHTTVMFRKDIFLRTGGYRAHYDHADDYDLFLRFSDIARIDNTANVLCQYRLHEAQTSARNLIQQIYSVIGAQCAAQARSELRAEPDWKGSCISREDLESLGLRSGDIDAKVIFAFQNLIGRYLLFGDLQNSQEVFERAVKYVERHKLLII